MGGPKVNITLEHCTLTNPEEGKSPGVEKPGQVTVTTNHLIFDEFVIRCNSEMEGALVVMIWLSNIAATGLRYLNKDMDDGTGDIDYD